MTEIKIHFVGESIKLERRNKGAPRWKWNEMYFDRIILVL